VPVEQLDPDELDLPPETPTLNDPNVFSMFLLLHFLHLSSVFLEVTPTSKSNFSLQSLQT
jgi:hypothetical protein